MEKIHITERQANQIAHVVQNCGWGQFENLQGDISYYVDWNRRWLDKVSDECWDYKSKNLSYDGSFVKSFMALIINEDALYALNRLMELAGYDKIEEIDDDSNPSGLVFNIVVK